MLAAFVSPGLFAVGAAAVSLPVLIHLLARRRFKRIRWAAMDFLIDAERRNRRRIRMEDWILLFLRCLAVLAIALFVARPYLPPANLPASWRAAQRTERIFLLDDTLSMAYASADGSTFDHAKAAAEQLIENIRRETPDDTLTLLRMTAIDRPVESGTYLEDAQIEDVYSRLRALAPTQQAASLPESLEAVAGLLTSSPEVINAAVYVISDFQRSVWVEPRSTAEEGARAAGLLDPLAAWARQQDRGLRVILVHVGHDDAANTALLNVAMPSGQAVAGTSGTVRVTAANFSDAPIEHVALQATVGQLYQPSKTIRELPAGQHASVDLEVEFLRSGDEALQVQTPPDALPADNVRFDVVNVVSAFRVLMVNGEPSVDEYDDELTFLKTALRPEGEVFSGIEVDVVDEVSFEDADLSAYHAVVLANVYRVGEPAVESLERYVRLGGGLILFLGDQVDEQVYNLTLFRDGEGLLPTRLDGRVRPTHAVRLQVANRLHPAMRGLSLQGDPLRMGDVPFQEYFRSAVLGVGDATRSAGDSISPAGFDEEAAPDSPGDPGQSAPLSASRPVDVLATFADEVQSPAIVERCLGRGKVILVTSSADKEWNHWPDHPTFLPVMLELVQHVARRADAGQSTFVGAPIELPLDPAVYEPDVLVRTPAYPTELEATATALAAPDGRGVLLTWPHTETSGVYQFHLRRLDGTTAVELVAVNVDTIESDLRAADEADLRRAAGSVPIEFIRGREALRADSTENRTELWRIFVSLAILILLGEHFLAWRWGRGR